jgi:hypothetical protein
MDSLAHCVAIQLLQRKLRRRLFSLADGIVRGAVARARRPAPLCFSPRAYRLVIERGHASHIAMFGFDQVFGGVGQCPWPKKDVGLVISAVGFLGDWPGYSGDPIRLDWPGR